MHSWLRCYLYFVFLIVISGNSLADTPTQQVIQLGGYPYPVVCSHPSDLNYCFDSTKANAEQKACDYALAVESANYQGLRTYESSATVEIQSNGVRRCLFKYKVESSTTLRTSNASLSQKNGMCPLRDSPPPRQVLVVRQGRWFPQELPSERCFDSCKYSNGQSFTYKHLVYTNGVMTEFKESTSSRLKSVQEFCTHEPEPVRNNEGEVTYESSCEDAVFSQICDFINWFRNDAEMPEAPQVENKNLDLGYLKTDHVNIEHNADNVCFDPIEFNLPLHWLNTQVKQEISFDQMCSKIVAMGNIWRALYLIAAAYIIFGGRK